jgi:hypothetical protein
MSRQKVLSVPDKILGGYVKIEFLLARSLYFVSLEIATSESQPVS